MRYCSRLILVVLLTYYSFGLIEKIISFTVGAATTATVSSSIVIMAVIVTDTPVTDALDSAIELPIRRTDNESKLLKESTIPNDGFFFFLSSNRRLSSPNFE